MTGNSLTGNLQAEAVSGKLAAQLAIATSGQPWVIPRTCLIQPLAEIATARYPDIRVLDETLLVDETRWQHEPVITLGRLIK